MVQFNLLPDIKIQYLKTKRQKHLFVLISSIVVIISLGFLLTIGTIVEVLQKKNLSDLKKDIKSNSAELKGTTDLSKILTVQNQLKSITTLHDKKVVSSRLFSFIAQTTPDAVSIAKLSVDYSLNTVIINGASDKLNTVNIFTDTLKFTKYTVGSSTTTKSAFSDVVLTSFARDDKTATYTIGMKFDPALFSGSSDVKLTIPNITTTRSEVEQPSVLFQNSGGQ